MLKSRQGRRAQLYTALALQRELTAYRSLLMPAGAVVADPETMLARLVRGCIALAFTAWLRYSLLHATTSARLRFSILVDAWGSVARAGGTQA